MELGRVQRQHVQKHTHKEVHECKLQDLITRHKYAMEIAQAEG